MTYSLNKVNAPPGICSTTPYADAQVKMIGDRAATEVPRAFAVAPPTFNASGNGPTLSAL